MPDAGRKYRRLTGTHGIPLTSVAFHLIRAVAFAAFVTIFVACYMPIGQYQSDSETAQQSGEEPGDDPGDDDPPEGSGTEDDPYRVTSSEALVELMSDDPDAYYELADDLDLSGEDWEPIDGFSGSFDGKGYTISGLTPKTGTGRQKVGLFGEIREGAVVRNVQVDVYIDDLNQSDIGAIASVNKGTIKNSFATGFIRGNQEIGGLVGRNEGLIKYSYARVELELDGGRSGGLVGVNSGGGVIHDSYAAATIRGANGGELDSGVGGLVGTVGWGSNVDRSFFDKDMEGPEEAIGDDDSGEELTAEALTTNQATSEAYLSGDPLNFDFNDVWAIDPIDPNVNDGYPYLRSNPPEA